MKESFEIRYPPTAAGKRQWAKWYGLNAYYAGKHWAQRKKDAEYWHSLTTAEMNLQKVRRFPFKNPVVITFYWNDNLDCSNHALMGKMIEDAMRGRVIQDDNRKWVKGIQHFFHNKDCIRVEITEVEQ